MATVIFSHGDKGGTGKSTIATALVDYCVTHNRPVGLIEGDDWIPDVGLRYVDHVPTKHVDFNQSGNREEAAIKLLDHVETLTSGEIEIVVVNLPGSASQTLDGIGEILIQTLNDAGHSCHMTYALGYQQGATDGIKRSMKSGLLSMLPKDNVTIVYNEHLGDPKQWHYVLSGARKKVGAGYNEMTIPTTKPPELGQHILGNDQETPLYEFAKKSNSQLTLAQTNFFSLGWLEPMYKKMESLLPPVENKGGGNDG